MAGDWGQRRSVGVAIRWLHLAAGYVFTGLAAFPDIVHGTASASC